MRTIASRILDARNTIEGKIIAVLLSVLLAAMCFNVAIFTDEAAADDETTGETTTTEVEGTTEGTGNVSTTLDTSENTTGSTLESGSPETSGTETDGQNEGTGNGGEEGDDEGNPNGTPEGGEEGTGDEGDGEGDDQEKPAEPITFDAETSTLTINGLELLDTATALNLLRGLEVQALDVKHLNLVNVLTISANCFSSTAHWRNLESVVIDGTANINDQAFSGLPSLSSVTLRNVSALADTLVSEPVPGNVEYRSKAFANCKALTSVSFSNVGYIGREAFLQCSGLTTLNLNGVSQCGISAFSYCSGLTSLTIDGAVSGMKSLSTTLFYHCTSLTSVTLKHMDTLGSNAFSGCTGIDTVVIEEVANTGVLTFINCSGISSVSISGDFETAGNRVFSGCNAINVSLSLSDVSAISEEAFCGAPLFQVTLEGVGTIGKNAFASCKSLSSVEMNGVDTISQYAFYNCANLETVSMDNVRLIENYAFWKCTSLKSINSLSNVKESIGGFAFLECSTLTGLTVADAVKMGYIGSNDEIMERVRAILAGKFQLGDVESIKELQKEWIIGAIDKSDNWNAYDNGTQIVQQVRWEDEANGVAEAVVDAYYTGQKQMDYIFVADLSASMAQLGNPDDSNARFYDMQSKLLDMASKLLQTAGYDCRVSIVAFGGYYTAEVPGTCETMDFTADYDQVEKFVLGMKPLYENTDYSLGLNGALDLLKSKDQDRTVSMVFLSDGRPTQNGATNLDTVALLKENDERVAGLAQQVKDAGVKSIYGVLHSPGTGTNVQYAQNAMGAVCDEYFTSSNTEDFGDAMNAAFTNAYGNNTVEVKVNSAQFDITNIQVTAGTTEYDEATGTIKWTLNGMPFTDHKLTYNMTLKPELAGIAGTNSYNLNGESTGFTHEGGATIDFTNPNTDQLTLTYTYTPAPGPGTGDPVDPQPQPVTPQPVGTVTVGTGAGAAAAAAAAAPAAAPVEDITDDATPMAQSPEGEGEEGEEQIIDDENPLGTFDVKHCTSHWFMLFGILLTAAYGVAVALRRKNFADDLDDFEKSITGETAKKRDTVSASNASHQAI